MRPTITPQTTTLTESNFNYGELKLVAFVDASMSNWTYTTLQKRVRCLVEFFWKLLKWTVSMFKRFCFWDALLSSWIYLNVICIDMYVCMQFLLNCCRKCHPCFQQKMSYIWRTKVSVAKNVRNRIWRILIFQPKSGISHFFEHKILISKLLNFVHPNQN